MEVGLEISNEEASSSNKKSQQKVRGVIESYQLHYGMKIMCNQWNV